jgi:glycosyltransferase involved in cell wall biosynthesis
VSLKVSIIIKALNEERNIAKAIESSLLAISEVESGEVILADSLSIDKTVEIASKYPIKIVQLTEQSDRSCGVGAQLGFQVAEGEYIYILDADMEFESGFMRDAVALLEVNSRIAGVAGIVKEMNLDSLEFKKRSEKKHANLSAGSVNSLDMGGLYRKEALVDVGYFTNRNLNSYEEFELGSRLKTAGWKLLRMDRPSIKHYGHTMEAFKLLLKRWQSGYIFGIGELLCSAYRQPHFFFIIKNMKQLKLYVTYIIWWFVMTVSLISAITNGWDFMIFIMLFLTPFVGMIIKKKSFYSGIYSVIASNLNAIGLCVGVFKKQRLAPSSIVNFTVIKDFKNQ